MVTNKYSKICFAMTNQAIDGYFIPFFDFDNVEYEYVITDLLHIQNKYELSDIYLIKSNNGFNALSLDKICFNVLKSIFKSMQTIDKKFVEMTLTRSYSGLRIGNDKKLIQILKNNSTFQKSLSHAMALIKFYNIDLKTNNVEFDNNMTLKIKLYRSEKDGFLTGELNGKGNI
jgi:hypothetical protein